jgi:hypothetical protein
MWKLMQIEVDRIGKYMQRFSDEEDPEHIYGI